MYDCKGRIVLRKDVILRLLMLLAGIITAEEVLIRKPCDITVVKIEKPTIIVNVNVTIKTCNH